MTGLFWLFTLFAAVSLAMCYLGNTSWQIASATTIILNTLWQVQAGSVSLALALAIFVFGLLPQTRGRATYREFLRRSWALPIVTLGVGSILLDGLVMLGVGHQFPASSPTTQDAHGQAVTVAVVVGLGSIVSIAVLFALTIKAIAPETSVKAQEAYRFDAVGEALRAELFTSTCLGIMQSGTGRLAPKFDFTTYAPGRPVESSRSGESVVHDISLWRLAALARYAKLRKHQAPLVHVWPGLTTSRANRRLLTVDARAWPLTRAWARACVRIKKAEPQSLVPALEALHAETLEHIRADRPVEALDSLNITSKLFDLVWNAYAAHGYRFERVIDQELVGVVPVAQELNARLYTQLRAAAVSRDEELRRHATRMPRALALRALRASAGDSIDAAVDLYAGIYGAVTDELANSQVPWPPRVGIARRRINQAMEPLVTFFESDVRNHIYRAVGLQRSSAATEEKRAELKSALYAAENVSRINETVLGVLRRMIELRDFPTLTHLLDHWRAPGATHFQNAVNTQGFVQQLEGVQTHAPIELRDEISAGQAEIARALTAAEGELCAMQLRLFAVALHREREVAEEAASARRSIERRVRTAAHRAERHMLHRSLENRDPAVAEILYRLPALYIWRTLPVALEQAEGADWYRRPVDTDFSPMHVVVGDHARPIAEVCGAFAHALMARPELIDGAEPGDAFMQAVAAPLRSAVKAARQETAWLRRYGVSKTEAARRADKILGIVNRVEQAVLDSAARSITQAPIDDSRVADLEHACAEAFTSLDFVGRLLAWAGRPEVIEKASEGHAETIAETPAVMPREFFTESRDDMESVARHIGQDLADALVKYIVELALDSVTSVDTTPATVGSDVEFSIERVRAHAAEATGRRMSPGAVGVLAPIRVDLLDILDLTATERDASSVERGSIRQTMLSRLGFTGDLEWYFAGMIGETPVVQLRGVPEDTLVVVDLARFVQLRISPSNVASGSNPSLTVRPYDGEEVKRRVRSELDEQARSTDPLVAEAAVQEFAFENGVRQVMQHVRVGFSLTGEVLLDDRAAARVLRIVENQG